MCLLKSLQDAYKYWQLACCPVKLTLVCWIFRCLARNHERTLETMPWPTLMFRWLTAGVITALSPVGVLSQTVTIPEDVSPDFCGINFNYENVAFGNDRTGWSYYIRLFNLFPNDYVQQFGWGQWSSPGIDTRLGSTCSRNPHLLACDSGSDEPYQDCIWPSGDERLLQCQLDICATQPGGEIPTYPIYGTFEGGAGHWPYIDGSNVRFTVPGGVSGYYNKFASTFLPLLNNPCTNLGGAIQVSNNILVPSDGFSFQADNDDGTIDGMMGYMLQRTPIGKMHENDNRNYWTLLLDTKDFSGPVVYSSSYFWEHPNSWHPNVQTWSDPNVKISYTTIGVEGETGIVMVKKGGFYYYRMQDTEIMLDDNSNFVTMNAAFAEYFGDWAIDIMEPILDGSSSAAPSQILARAQANRRKPDCFARGTDDLATGTVCTDTLRREVFC